MTTTTTTDFDLYDDGSVMMLTPRTDAAREWVDEFIGEDNGFQPFYPKVIVERRYIGDIVRGLIADGLTIE
ncbi:MAG: hypothetical protein ACK4S4_15660 [Pyrinomonadaceae bacterium]